MTSRRAYEENVIYGSVFPLVLLLAVPFLKSTAELVFVAISCGLILVITTTSAIWFRHRLENWRGMKIWRLITALLLCGGFFIFALAMANFISGTNLAALLAAVIVLLFTSAAKDAQRARHTDNPVPLNPRVIGQVSAIGGALGSVAIGVLGQISVALIVCTLFVTLTITTGLIAMKTRMELREREAQTQTRGSRRREGQV